MCRKAEYTGRVSTKLSSLFTFLQFVAYLARTKGSYLKPMAKQKTRKPRQGSMVVYQLIERMSSDEKRYFKMFAQKYDKGNSNICLVLFNAINHQISKNKALNDVEIRKQLKGLALESYFVSAKNKLKNMLCDALYEMSAKHMEDYTILKGIGVAGILHNKGLLDESDKQLKQAMDTAVEKEFYTLWLEAFKHKLNFSVDNMSSDFSVLHNWHDEMQGVMALQHDYANQVFNNRLAFNAYVATEDKFDSRTVDFFNEPRLIKNADNAKSAYGRYLALNCLIFYYNKQSQHKQVQKIALQQKDILKATLSYTLRYAGEFLVAYQNYLNGLNPVRDAEQIVQGSRDMEKTAQQYLTRGANPTLPILVVNNATMMRLNVFIEQNNTGELKKEVAHAINVYKQTKSRLGNANELVLLCLIKDSLFAIGKYDEAMKWIKQIKAVSPAGIMNKYKLCNLFTELMILIEKNATARLLRNSEENLRQAITRFNFTETQQQQLIKLLKLIGAVATVRNTKEESKCLADIIDFAAGVKHGTDGILKNLVSESGAASWARKRKTT